MTTNSQNPVDVAERESFDTWLKRYVGEQDPFSMRFGVSELEIAFEAGAYAASAFLDAYEAREGKPGVDIGEVIRTLEELSEDELAYVRLTEPAKALSAILATLPSPAKGEALSRLRAEIVRQCSIGAGSFHVDNGFGESGLWEIAADLDPAGLSAALASPANIGGEKAQIEEVRRRAISYAEATERLIRPSSPDTAARHESDDAKKYSRMFWDLAHGLSPRQATSFSYALALPTNIEGAVPEGYVLVPRDGSDAIFEALAARFAMLRSKPKPTRSSAPEREAE